MFCDLSQITTVYCPHSVGLNCTVPFPTSSSTVGLVVINSEVKGQQPWTRTAWGPKNIIFFWIPKATRNHTKPGIIWDIRIRQKRMSIRTRMNHRTHVTTDRFEIRDQRSEIWDSKSDIRNSSFEICDSKFSIRDPRIGEIQHALLEEYPEGGPHATYRNMIFLSNSISFFFYFQSIHFNSVHCVPLRSHCFSLCHCALFH